MLNREYFTPKEFLENIQLKIEENNTQRQLINTTRSIKAELKKIIKKRELKINVIISLKIIIEDLKKTKKQLLDLWKGT